jgi:hypothetical protein
MKREIIAHDDHHSAPAVDRNLLPHLKKSGMSNLMKKKVNQMNKWKQALLLGTGILFSSASFSQENTHSVTLQWDAVEFATSYRLEERLDGVSWGDDGVVIIDSYDTSETLSDRAAGEYIYRVIGCVTNPTTSEVLCDEVAQYSDDSPVTIEADATTSSYINFNDYTIQSYGGSGQDISGTVGIEDNGFTLTLEGNIWKKISFPYTVTTDTVLEFDFKSTRRAEIHGIGFAYNNDIDKTKTFKLYGTQNWGNSTYRYNNEAEFQHFVIPVGEHFTGSMPILIFALDHDVTNPTGNSYYKNVRVYQSNPVDVTYPGDGEGEASRTIDPFIATATITAGNEGNIQTVEFSIDGVNWFEATLQVDGSYQHDFGLLDAGDYVLHTRVTLTNNEITTLSQGIEVVKAATERRVIFIHTDLLGSPAAETDKQGAKL